MQAIKTDKQAQQNTDYFFPLGVEGSGDSANKRINVASTSVLERANVEHNEGIARVTLLTVAAFYGTNFGCVKILDQALNPSVAATLRFSLAALVFLPYLVQHAKRNPRLILGGLEVGIYSFFGYWAQAHSLMTSSASTAAFICSLSVIVVPLLEATLGTEKADSKVPWYQPLLPALLATAGVGCLELGGSEAPGVGDLWAFAQPLFFGLGFWRVEGYMKGSREPGEAQAFTGAMMAMVAAGSMVWAGHDFLWPLLQLQQQADAGGIAAEGGVVAALQGQLAHLSDWHVGLAVLWTGIMTTAITSYGENMAMKSLSSSETTVIFSTEPLWGTAFAALALGESIGPNVFIGAFFILSACVWSSLGASLTISGLMSTVGSRLVLGEELEGLMSKMAANWDALFGGIETMEDKM